MLSTSLSTLGSTPGVLNTNPKQSIINTPTTSTAQGTTLPSYQAPKVTATTPGLLPGVNSSSQQKTVTTNVDGSSTTTHPAQSNPSVLAQQQALNKLGAGLVEDGIAGPKTSAAIAKYGVPGSTTSSTTSTVKAPDDPSNKFNTLTGQPNPNYKDPNAPIVSQQTQSQQVDPITGVNANNSTSAGAYTPPDQGVNGISQGGLIANAVGQSQAPSQAYLDAQAEAKRISDEQTALAQDFAKKTNNIQGTAGFLTQANGEQGLLQNQYNTGQAALASQYAGATNRLGAANTQQGLQQSALGTAIGANAPITGVPYGTATINPATGQPYAGSSQYGTGPAAAANVQSIKDYTTKINDIKAAAPAADAAISILNSYAQAVGGGSTPILQGLQQLYGSTAQGSAAVAGFKAQLQSVRQAWSAIEGGDANAAIPDNITADQIKQVQQQLKTDAQNKISGYTNQVNTLSGSSSGSTGGTMFGSFFG